jgi:hypothetical protein
VARFAVLIGLALVAVSVTFVALSGAKSFTQWIPAVLGVAVLLFAAPVAKGGVVPLWGIRLIALIGLVACGIQLVQRGFDMTSRAQQAQAITAALCLLLFLRSLSPSPPTGPQPLEWSRRPPR